MDNKSYIEFLNNRHDRKMRYSGFYTYLGVWGSAMGSIALVAGIKNGFDTLAEIAMILPSIANYVFSGFVFSMAFMNLKEAKEASSELERLVK